MSLVRLLFAILLLQPAVLYGQQPESRRIIVALQQGGFVAFRIGVTPLKLNRRAGQQSELSLPFAPRVVKDEGNTLHRLLADEKGRIVFVYDLVITKLESPKRFQVSARPLSTGFEEQLRVQNPVAFQHLAETRSGVPTLAHATEQQSVKDGETFALDLLINEPLGVKVVDYVTVASESWLLAPVPASQPLRDFGLSNVELAVKDYELFLDEQEVLSSASRRNCTGALLWFALPGQGRFVFSLIPYEGYDFRKIGAIENNKIVFNWKGTHYEWISRAPIVGSGGSWNLWVLHDPDYVDIFALPLPESAKKGQKPREFTGITVVIPEPKKPEIIGLQPQPRAPESSKRVWVTIGGAKTIEGLLPKK
jgi:hypothetical protein